MRVLGIDPSSTCCGVAIVDRGGLVDTSAWDKKPSLSAAANLYDYYLWQCAYIRSMTPDMACVEFLSVSRNMDSVRAVSHFQAAAVLACKSEGNMLVVEARVTSARKVVLGRGNLSKEEAWKIVRERFPEHKFRRADKGGMDEADALVLALAGPAIAER